MVCGESSVPQAVRCLALDAAAMATIRLLAENAIPCLLLKGPAVARRLYPESPGKRVYCDVDLLVAPANFAAAEQALAVAGYQSVIEGARQDDGSWHERDWRTPGAAGLGIDLHRSCAGVSDPDAFWAAMWSTAEEIPLVGRSVSVPGAGAAALLLALHAAAPAASTKPIRELQLALEILPEHDWQTAVDLARATGSDSAYAVGLRLVPAGAELALRLDLPTAATPLEWITAHHGSQGAVSIAKLGAQTGTMARLRYFGRRLVPSPGWMRYDSALARRGWAGLLLAYAIRAASLAGKTPRAYRELRTATVLARGPSPVSTAEASRKS